MRLRVTTKATWSRLSTSEPLPLSAKKNIALIGFMATGKSTVGRKLARRLKRRFVDLDDAIEAREGMKVREIFGRKGEAYFRKVEKEALQGLLQHDAQVIATGGGAVRDAENLRLMKEKSLLVCLEASPETLLRRVGKSDHRPLLRGRNKRKRLQELLKQRERAYAQAHVSVDTDCLTVDEVVGKIVEVIKGVRG